MNGTNGPKVKESLSYSNEVQRTQGRSTSTVNGHLSALRAWCAWLTEERYLEVNPARRIKLVGRQEASKPEGLRHSGQCPAASGSDKP